MMIEKGQEIKGVVKIIWAAVTNTDLNEGRGSSVDYSYHLTETDAKVGASHIGVMGSDGDVQERVVLQISDTEYILLPKDTVTIKETAEEAAKLRESALKKLTPAEQAAFFKE